MRNYMQIVSDNVPLARDFGGLREPNPRTRLSAGTLVEESFRADGWSFIDVRTMSMAPTSGWLSPRRDAGPKCEAIPGPGFMRNRALGGRTLPEILGIGGATQGWVRSVALLPIGYRPGLFDPLTLYVNRRLWELTEKYDAVTYSQKVRDVEKGSIDCSGWVEFANCAIYDELVGGVAAELLPAKFKKLFDTAAAWQMTGWKKETGGWLTGKAFSTDKLLPGMIIGMNAVANDAIERPKGIDHIVQVAWHPTTHVPHITQSSGGQGVNFEDMDSWFKKWKKKIGTDDLYAVDPYAKARAGIGAWLSTH
ncbi:MAG: hypothetical protein KF889_10450 [Alphaproteobacteria bacterium]|nr:hypothetical protein [Alphaproteobacteria bacterium]MCW5741244.1 hypothetical protein [Alphaproteobacteria bacterium]